jgi:chitin synthase
MRYAVKTAPLQHTDHVQYTTQMELGIEGKFVDVRKGSVPVQLVFCLKQENKQKINSHRWFFQAFSECIIPKYCVLLDAGTKPGKDSIFRLWRAFDKNDMVAGACGEIKAMKGKMFKNLLNPLVATQNFEYKMSNILDKPLESAFGFISVLPGAFSAYRWQALQGEPLRKYFLGEKMHSNSNFFTANMYLAEDRILCYELVAKAKANWILQYVKGSTGETDVPDNIAEFIGQRRRWLNGSFFAALYTVVHFYKLWSSGHSFFRKIMFTVEIIYQIISMLFAWFALVSLVTSLVRIN